MESEFLHDNENFEQFLRDSTQDFKMYPSRKVWYSLYNDLHPGSKWPSLAVCLILISTILFIDISNNNKLSKINQPFTVTASATETDGNNKLQKIGTPGVRYFVNGTGNFLLNTAEYNAELESKANPQILLPTAIVRKREVSEFNSIGENSNRLLAENNPQNSLDAHTTIEVASTDVNATESRRNDISLHPDITSELNQTMHTNGVAPQIDGLQKNGNEDLTGNNTVDEKQFIVTENTLATTPIDVASIADNSLETTTLDEELWKLSWVEDHAFYNKPKTSKWKKRAGMQFYVTPSLGYRAMFKNNDYESATNSLIAMNPNEEEDVNQNAAYNMEFGFAIHYELNKKWRAKAGLQFNHTNYIVNAGQLFHPSQTTMIMTDQNTGLPVVESHTSYYSNRPTDNNETRLTNSTIQFSMPLGVDYALAKQKNFTWRVGLTIQPTYIANGEAYLISSDTKNYVSLPSMMKKWNANAAFETFISYKTNAGFNIDFGPQFRYQLKSTYKKQYGYSEKLYNIGLKLGITRGF